jgi:short-subunit dehydrogenase
VARDVERHLGELAPGRAALAARRADPPVETPFIDAMGAGVRSTAVFRSALSVDEEVRACLRALDSRQPTHVVGVRNWLPAQTARFSPRALTARIGAALLSPSSKPSRPVLTGASS